MKQIADILNDLSSENSELSVEIASSLKHHKQAAVEADDQTQAKYLWCLEQIYVIKKHYLDAFSMMRSKNYSSAWRELDYADNHLYNLTRHFDISKNEFHLLFVSNTLKNMQRLYPYIWFTSREGIIKKARCTVCNKVVSIRKGCGHVVGDIYNGEMCCRTVEDYELLRISFVKNPADKYTVLRPKDMEYNYEMLEMLMGHIKKPYEEWDLVITKTLKPEYQGVRGSLQCPCGSGKKYKKCCLLTGENLMDHYQLCFKNVSQTFFTPMKMVSTWKE